MSKKHKTIFDELVDTEEGRKLYQREGIVMDFADLLYVVMEKKNITKERLAEKIGKSKRYITSMLDGNAKIDIRMMADIMTALGCNIYLDVADGFEEHRIPNYVKEYSREHPNGNS